MIYVFVLGHIFIIDYKFGLDFTRYYHRSYVVAKEKAKIIDIAYSLPHPRVEFYIVTSSGSNLERLKGYIECEKLDHDYHGNNTLKRHIAHIADIAHIDIEV